MLPIPKISIIIPIFNAEKYIPNSVGSILSQSFKDFELLLIDDGSRDKSAQICDEYASKDKRIQVFHKTNGGVTSARKLGWQKSRGEWIVFVDADDVAHANCLEVLITHALSNDYDIVNAAFQSIPSQRLWIHKKTGSFNRQQYLESFIKNQTFGVVYASIYKKSIFQESTFAFDASLKIGEDVLTKIELGLRVTKVLNTEEILYDYYENQTSTMNQKVRHPSYFERYYHKMEELLKLGGVTDEHLKIMHNEKFDEQIKAFFSPFIKFDDTFYQTLKTLQKHKSNEKFRIDKTQIFGVIIKYKQITKFIKTIIFLRVFGKHLLNRNIQLKREILY